LRQMRSRCVQMLSAAIDVWAPLQRMLLESISASDADVVAYLHDPLATAALLDRSLMQTETRRLRPAIIDGAFHLKEDRTASPVDVIVDVDARRFVDFVMQRLQRLP
jgi:inosine-uridine nucleoside N-ribohydrolase